MKSRFQKRLVGIQRKIFIAMVGLFLIVGGFMFVVIMHIGKVNIYRSMEKQYNYVNENAFTLFKNQYNEMDRITDGWIISGAVQNSFKKEKLTREDKKIINDSMSIFQGSNIDYYLYVSNQFDVFSQKKLNMKQTQFYRLPMIRSLDSYAKTSLYWGKDPIFESNKNHLFVLRHVRSITHDARPGILCFRMNANFMNHIFATFEEKESVQLLYDQSGTYCDSYNPSNYHLSENKLKWIQSQIRGKEKVVSGKGLVCTSTDEQTGYHIITYVPDSVVNRYLYNIFLVFLIAAILGLVLIILLSNIASELLTKPILIINEYMTSFDNTKLNAYLNLNTNTELDSIGNSYNAMIDRVSGLMNEVREDERLLREQEIHTLVNQLHPHFLYNTLDTIYMLARMSHEETIAKMIYALSKYLRINLSKGADEISVEKELEQVCAYMDIQKIRNDDLFEYKIVCDENTAKQKVCKMILQPLVENAIKHGFSRMRKGGIIKIEVHFQDDFLTLSVENNGMCIEKEKLEQLNKMEQCTLEELEQINDSTDGGYGLKNIIIRLRLRYGDGVHFFYTTGEQTCCTIQIPNGIQRKEQGNEA